MHSWPMYSCCLNVSLETCFQDQVEVNKEIEAIKTNLKNKVSNLLELEGKNLVFYKLGTLYLA